MLILKHKILSLKFKCKKWLNSFKRVKPQTKNNVVHFHVKGFNTELMDKNLLTEEVINLNMYFKNSMLHKENDNTVIPIHEVKPIIDSRYETFIKYVKQNCGEDGNILVTNNEIITRLQLSKKILENLKNEGVNKNDLVVKNGRTILNVSREKLGLRETFLEDK